MPKTPRLTEVFAGELREEPTASLDLAGLEATSPEAAKAWSGPGDGWTFVVGQGGLVGATEEEDFETSDSKKIRVWDGKGKWLSDGDPAFDDALYRFYNEPKSNVHDYS